MAGNAGGALKTAARRLGLTAEEFIRRRESGEKYCWRCKEWHPVVAFRADRSRGDGLSSGCAESMAAAARGAYTPRSRRSKRGEFFVATRGGDARQARARVNHRIVLGDLPAPNALPCADCGHAWRPGERRHEYDHHLGYAAEHHFDVQAVCTLCHARREIARGKRVRARGARGRFDVEAP